MIVGGVISGFLSLVVWSFAYFGFIDLGLPDRFNYEKMNHLVGTYLPKDFSRKEITVNNFWQGGDQTLMYIGQKKEFYYLNNDIESDTILFFDKTDKKYQLSYRFTPQSSNKEAFYPVHVHSVGVSDVNGDGRSDVIVAFSEMGAHWSPPFVVIFYSDGDKVYIAGAPANLSKYNSQDMIENKYDMSQKVTNNRADMVFAGKGVIAYVVRTDDECYGCSESHVFRVSYLSIFEGKVVKAKSDDNDVRGYDNLLKMFEQKEIKPLEYSTF